MCLHPYRGAAVASGSVSDSRPTVYGHHAEPFLPRSDPDEDLLERLADLVEWFNSEVDPGNRVDLHLEIVETRRRLGAGRDTPGTSVREIKLHTRHDRPARP